MQLPQPHKLHEQSCHRLFKQKEQPCEGCPVFEVLRSNEALVTEQGDGCFGEDFRETVVPVFDSTGTITRIIHMAKDISEQRRHKEEMFHAQKMEAVGTLAGGLAHDFNNLLQTIIGYSEIIDASHQKDQQLSDDLEHIKNAVQQGSSIIRQLLTVSRKTSPKVGSLQLNKTVEDVIDLLQNTIPKAVTIELELQHELHYVKADEGQLEQTLINLSINAVRAMSDDGTLSIRTRNTELLPQNNPAPELPPGHYVELSISDTGCGISSKHLPHIFEPFYTTSGPNEGSGLGLAMAYSIIQAHTGHILCESAENQGTTFRIFLPAYKAEPGPQSEEAQPAEQDLMGTETILIVDDDSQIQQIAEQNLTSKGYRVLKADNGQHALEVFANHTTEIDLVILDQNISMMQGWECLIILHDLKPELPILMTNGSDQQHNIPETSNDFVDHISKPYTQNDFLRKIRRLLDPQPREA